MAWWGEVTSPAQVTGPLKDAQKAEGYWYDQEEDEWIMVVDGKAILALQNPDEVVTLQSGDHLVISAHRKHRVESTTSPTVWLALWLCPE